MQAEYCPCCASTRSANRLAASPANAPLIVNVKFAWYELPVRQVLLDSVERLGELRAIDGRCECPDSVFRCPLAVPNAEDIGRLVERKPRQRQSTRLDRHRQTESRASLVCDEADGMKAPVARQLLHVNQRPVHRVRSVRLEHEQRVTELEPVVARYLHAWR